MFLIVMFNYTALFRATHNTESTTLNTILALSSLSTLDTPLEFTSTSTYHNCASLLLCVSSLVCSLPPCSNYEEKHARPTSQ